VHVTVYKYRDQEGNVFITARPRGFAFLRDTEHVKYLSMFSECLSKLGKSPPPSRRIQFFFQAFPFSFSFSSFPFSFSFFFVSLSLLCLIFVDPPVAIPLKMENLPQIFFPLNFEVQSITCELFGANMPHLIKYPFDVRLKVFFYF
jgi:hypothetical protein